MNNLNACTNKVQAENIEMYVTQLACKPMLSSPLTTITLHSGKTQKIRQ